MPRKPSSSRPSGGAHEGRERHPNHGFATADAIGAGRSQCLAVWSTRARADEQPRAGSQRYTGFQSNEVAEARLHDRVGARRLEGLRAVDHFGKVGATPKVLVGARRQHDAIAIGQIIPGHELMRIKVLDIPAYRLPEA
jgi:hypothetical protein